MSDSNKKVVAVPLDKLESLLADLDVANADQVKGGSQLGNTQLSSTQLSTNQLHTSQLNTQSKQSLLQQIRVAASSWRVVL